MSASTKNVAKTFNVDFMTKRSAYIYASDASRIVIVDTYLLDSKKGIYEHLIGIGVASTVPTDIDRFICITG